MEGAYESRSCNEVGEQVFLFEAMAFDRALTSELYFVTKFRTFLGDLHATLFDLARMDIFLVYIWRSP